MAEQSGSLKILVPFDFSELSWHALHVSAGLNGGRNLQICLLTVSDPGQNAVRERHDDEQVANRLASLPAHVGVRFVSKTGRFVKAVLDAILSEEIDLVVIGTKGSRGWDGIFLGSHAEKIVRISPVPVLCIPGLADIGRVRNVVIPLDVDLDVAEPPACLRQVTALLQGRYHLIYVRENQLVDDAEAIQKLKTFGSMIGIDHFVPSVLTAERMVEGILHYATEVMADVIIMVTQGNSDADHMFRPSVAADVVNHSRVPVLTCLLDRQADLSK